MPRLCSRCLPTCCVSRKKRKSFPIHAKQQAAEVEKVFIRNVENIRVTSRPNNHHHEKQYDKNTKSKATLGQKTKKQSIKENNSLRSPSPLSTLFNKSKQLETPSPLPMAVSDGSEDNHVKAAVNTSSSCSSSTNSDLKSKKKHRSSVETYDISKKKSPLEAKPSAKSKLVLENVRKMIKDQNIQQPPQQHFDDTRQQESIRL